MSRTFDYDLKTGQLTPSRASPREREEGLARLDRLTRLLDTAVAIPGTNIRFGADGVIGLVPFVGDAVTTALSAWIVYEAHRLGAPAHVLARMGANVAIDGAVGAIPFLGDVFDVVFKANRRNLRILQEWAEREGR